VWRSTNGERIGTYEGHQGSIWGLDITRDSKYLVTGSADTTVKVWEVLTGRCLHTLKLPGPVHAVAFAEGDRQLVCCNDPFGEHVFSGLHVFDFNLEAPEQTPERPRLTISLAPTEDGERRIKVSRVSFLPLNEGVLASLDTGALRIYDPFSGKLRGEYKEHEGAISSFSFNDKKTLLITAAHDRTAKIWDVKEMKVLRTYVADVPLNGASISPIREHVIVGGGQEAMSVTTTAVSAGKFETRFYHMIFENELGRVKGHFGPINALAFHPDGQSFTSGAEDGYLRLHRLDSDYFALGDEDNLDDPVLSSALKDGVFEQLEQEEAERIAKEAAEQAAVQAAAGAASAGGGNK
jgi:translation initiation factor 3 subunit I